jgi:hypothetical protein
VSLTTDSGRVPSSLSPGRRRLTPLQMRTTSGPTSRNEVVPRVVEDQRLVSAGERRNRCARRRPAFRSCSETSAWSARESVIRAALFAARCRASLSQWGEENDGGSEPAARARSRPPVRRGRSRHGCLCRCRLSSTACSAARSAAYFPHRTCLIAIHIFRTIRSCSSGQRRPQTGLVRLCFPASCCPRKCASRASYSMSICGPHEVSTSGGASTPSAITTTMLHLCSARCKALRFASPALRAAFGP